MQKFNHRGGPAPLRALRDNVVREEGVHHSFVWKLAFRWLKHMSGHGLVMPCMELRSAQPSAGLHTGIQALTKRHLAFEARS